MRDLFIGFDANGRKLYLTPEQRKSTHMHVIGTTGSGKSKFLEWMIRGDIRNGEGLCLIDRHGSLYEDVVKWCAYHNLLDRDIILLNPSEGDYVKGFNPFQKSQAELSVQIDNQITVILRAWGTENTDETPSLERWLRCVMEAIVEKEQSIVASEYLIDFFEPEVRDYLTSSLSRQLTQSDWRSISEAKTPRQFYIDMQMLSTRNRLTRFLCSPQICRFMGMQDNNIDIGEIMDQGKILLVNLRPSDYLSRQNSKVFGALLVNEFFEQAFRRKRDPFGNPPKPFYVYIDEFQEFVNTPDIAEMLDEVRKCGVHLILAHQRFGQIERASEDLLDAVLTNAKIRAVFGGSRRETAKLLVEEMFVNQLDLKEIKKAIWTTKFWPVYGRDKVYGAGHGSQAGTSASSGLSLGQSMQFTSGEGWFGLPVEVGSTTSQVDLSGSTSFEGESDFESEADIPIFYPMPFEELSSLEYWSLEEQIWRMSEALKGQFTRHCFVQVPGQKTQPMLVPLVREYNLFQEVLIEYQQELYNQIRALPAATVDKLLGQAREQLELKAQELALTQPRKRVGRLERVTSRKIPKLSAKVMRE